MKFSKKIKNIILLATLVGGLFFLGLILFFSKNLVTTGSMLIIKPLVINNPIAQVTHELPVRLKIPGINVDVNLEYVGVTEAGAMDMPKSLDKVAWFEPGVRPGDFGSAVIAGHFGKKNNKVSAFDNLNKLVKGDRIYIEDDKGMLTPFVVSGIKLYNPNANTADVFISNDGKAHLNLITCGGVWNSVAKSYSERLVVFTDKE